MPELVADCPRCGASKTTFDVKGNIHLSNINSPQQNFELFCCCRNCNHGTVFSITTPPHAASVIINNLETSITQSIKIIDFVRIKNQNVTKAPDFIPDDLKKIFEEASTCLSVDCFNAAGTMFRLCVDQATQKLLPQEDVDGLNTKTRRDLGLRLPWLFNNGKLSKDLIALSNCIKEDGNDGAHRGSLGKIDAEDLQDFTSLLLERMFTETERLKQAEERRQGRHKKQ